MNTLINTVILVLGLLLSFIIILIDNVLILSFGTIICLLLVLLFKVKISSIKYFANFIIVIFIFNYLLTTLNNSLLVSLRLLIMYLIVNILSKKIGTNNIASLLGKIFHSRDLYLIISLALAFIPIMLKELKGIKSCLISKGYPLTLKNILKNPSVYIITFMNNLFIRVNELEKVIISKGY